MRNNTSNLIKINTAYCDEFLRNKPRNLIWNNIDHIFHKVVRRAIATRFDLPRGSHQATCTDVGMVFSIASSNILTWTVGYSILSSGNFYSILLTSLEVHSTLEGKDNFCWILQCFVFFCACRLMRPLSKVETCRDSSSHNFVENMVNIIPYQIAWFVS